MVEQDLGNQSELIRRRPLLASIGGVALASVAGCASDGNDNPAGDETPTDSEETPTSSGKTATELDETPTDDDETPTDDDETSTETEGDSPGDTEGKFIDEIDGQVELIYGETAKLSNGVEVTIHRIVVEERLGDEEPEEREAFALAEIEAVNNGDEQALLPDSTDPGVQLLFEDQQVGPTFNYGAFSDSEYEPYEGDDVQPGVRREGYILYEVSAGLSESDIDFLWQDEYFVAGDLEGGIDVRWTAG